MRFLRAIFGASIACISIAATSVATKLQTCTGYLDNRGCFHYEATVAIDAPAEVVFDSLAHPERLTKYAISLKVLRVTDSRDHSTRILEWGVGEGELRPRNGVEKEPDWVNGELVVAREKLVLDPRRLKVSRQELKHLSYSDLREDFSLSGSKGATLLDYHQLSCLPDRKPVTTGDEQKELTNATKDLMSYLDLVKADIFWRRSTAKSSTGSR